MHIKRILIAVFVILLIFAGCHPRKKTGTMGEVRAAWISYIELSSILDMSTPPLLPTPIIRRNTIRRRNTSPARSGRM